MNVQTYKDLFNLIISPKNEYKNQQLSIPNALYNLLLSSPAPSHLLHRSKIKTSSGDYFLQLYRVWSNWCFTLISYIYPFFLVKYPLHETPVSYSFSSHSPESYIYHFHHLLFPWKQLCRNIFSYLTFLHKPFSTLESYWLLPCNGWEINIATGTWTKPHAFLT